MMMDIPPPFDQTWFLALLGFVIGINFGSFITMLSYRLPRGMSIITPPSTCPSCKTVLGFTDLFPILSWLFSKGKCRHCKAHIGVRYVVIEVVAGALGAITLAITGVGWMAIPMLSLIVLIMTAAIIVLERRNRSGSL